MKKILLILVLANLSLNLSAQKIRSTKKISDQSEHIIGSNFEGVIFSASYRGGRGSKRFTPTHDQVIELEQALKNYLTKSVKLADAKFVQGHIRQYVRQYQGSYDDKGKPVIWVNCFWDDRTKRENNWLKETISVLDGGPYFWSISYDLQTHHFFNFDINGVA